MRIIPKVNSLRKSILLYRGLRYRRGHGVHSPFVFNLISKVIDEKTPYYSFYDIELIRAGLLNKEEFIAYKDRRKKEKKRSRTIGKIVKDEAISPKKGALLFRLANYFKVKNILQIGSSMGISTLYLTSYSNNLRCISLENITEFTPILSMTLKKAGQTAVDVREGDLKKTLPTALKDLKEVDMVFFNTPYDNEENWVMFEECLKHINENSFFIFDGIRANSSMRKLWKEVCDRPEVTISVDLYSMGIVFFNPKLHKRDYIVYF